MFPSHDRGVLNVKYIGLTATPYRLKSGYIYGKGKVFSHVCFEAPIKRLTKEGYLSPLRMFGSKDSLDTKGLKLQGGDFKISDMADKYNRKPITDKIVKGLEQYKKDYKHWLIFCIDIDHAEQVSAALGEIGVTSEAVHSKSPRDQAILDFKAGKIQALTNVNILTVGFDYPEIDLIVCLRPTKSPVLHVQSLGRGLRVADGKSHCLVKDFAGNLARLGPIDNVCVTEPEQKGKGGTNPFMKTCPDCEALVFPAVRECECGHKFKFQHNLTLEAYTPTKWFPIKSVFYNIHHSNPPSLKISYRCGMRIFSEWICLDHKGYAGFKARKWVDLTWRGSSAKPATVKDLMASQDELRKPTGILVEEGGKYPKILEYKWTV